MKEGTDYIFKQDLSDRLGISVKSIERAAKQIGLKSRRKIRRGHSERYYTIDEVLLIKKKLNLRQNKSEEIEHKEDGNNYYKSYSRILW